MKAMRSVTLLNIHYGIRTAAWEVASLFSLSYLYKQGLPLYAACLVYGGMFFMRLFFIPLANRLCLTKGVRYTLTVGTVLFALRYLMLIPIDGVNWKIFPFLLLSGIADPMYRLSYNTFFSLLSADENRGKDVGVRESLVMILMIIAPFFGGMLLSYNRILTFFILMTLTFLSIVPLNKIAEIKFEPYETVEKTTLKGSFLMFFFACAQYSFLVWQLTVFQMVTESYSRFGFLLSLAALFQAVFYLLFGHSFDTGKRKILTVLGYGLMLFLCFMRFFLATTVPAVIACDFIYAVASPFYFVATMRFFYQRLNMSRMPVDFSQKSEAGRVWGVCFVMVVAAAMALTDLPLRWILAVGVAALTANLSILLTFRRSV